MAMGIVSDKEFELELDKINPRREENSSPNKDSSINGEVIDLPSKGRGNGNVEVPNSLRRVIGQTAIEDGRQEALDLAKQFGISPSSVGAYTAGATSTSSYEERPNQDVLIKTREKISKVARGKLMKALRHITDDKLENAKPRDLAGIAKDMSVIFKNMEPEPDRPNGNGNNGGPTFVFYSPQFRKEEHFEIVHAKE